MAVILVGMLYYLMGIGETIVYRERMQDAADSGAFAAAVIHARGMNVIALMNNVMAAVLAVLVVLKVVEDLLTAAVIIATAICALPFGAGAWACPLAALLEVGREYTSSVIEGVEPTVETIVDATNAVSSAVRTVYPIAAQYKVTETGFDTYDPPTTRGFMVPLLEPLPVEEDDSSLLCKKAGEQAGRIIGTVIGLWPIRRFVGTAVGGLASTFASHYCGDSADKAFRVEEDAELGDENFQLRSIMFGDAPFDDNEAGVKVATFGQDGSDSLSAFKSFGEISFAQAEFYYDGDVDRKDWMWHMRWRARLRRFTIPSSIPGLGGINLNVLDEAIVH
ncbi:MAG: hypothetical protein AAGF12_27125 [Myxococcota bacterium]